MRLRSFILPLLGFAGYTLFRPTKSARELQSISRMSDSNERKRRIAEAAYYRAERRGFASGFELEDWLAAEEEVISDLNLTSKLADGNKNKGRSK